MQPNCTTKTCSTCKTDKPISDFGNHAKNKDGLRYSCKECESAKRRKQYWDNHTPEQLEYAAEYAKAFRAGLRPTRKVAMPREEHLAREAIAAELRRIANPRGDRSVESRKYRQSHHDQIVDAIHRRRALILGSQAEKISKSVVGELCGWICCLCDNPTDPTAKWPDPNFSSLEHLIPISAFGPHIYSNVSISHLACNLHKSAKADVIL
jgi:hypothetical protein